MQQPDFGITNKPVLSSGPLTPANARARIEEIAQLAAWSGELTGKCIRNQQIIHASISQLRQELNELRPQIENASSALATIEAVEAKLKEVSGKQLNEIDLVTLRAGITDAIAASKIIKRVESEVNKVKHGLDLLTQGNHEKLIFHQKVEAMRAELKTSSIRKRPRLSPESQRLIDS